MTTLELKSIGLQELDFNEMQELEGGWLKEIVISLIENWSDFTDGIKDGYRASR